MNRRPFVGTAGALCGLASNIHAKQAEQASGWLRATKRATTNSNRSTARIFHTDDGETHQQCLADRTAYGSLNALKSALETR